jgi:hypothetical protein
VSAAVKVKSPNPYTIYLCMYRCKVCDERGRGRGVNVGSAAVKVKSPLAEGGSSTNNERP